MSDRPVPKRPRVAPDISKMLGLPEFKAAGVVPYDATGFWLGLQKGRWVDFGGKREGSEDAWRTAARELWEESGVDVKVPTRAPVYLPIPKQVVFAVETDRTPAPNRPNETITEVRKFGRWPPPVELHPRLKFDKGGVLRAEMRALGFA